MLCAAPWWYVRMGHLLWWWVVGHRDHSGSPRWYISSFLFFCDRLDILGIGNCTYFCFEACEADGVWAVDEFFGRVEQRVVFLAFGTDQIWHLGDCLNSYITVIYWSDIFCSIVSDCYHQISHSFSLPFIAKQLSIPGNWFDYILLWISNQGWGVSWLSHYYPRISLVRALNLEFEVPF